MSISSCPQVATKRILIEMSPVAQNQFTDSTTRGPGITALYWILSAFSGLTLAARFWSRSAHHEIGKDDWMMFVAWVGQPKYDIATKNLKFHTQIFFVALAIMVTVMASLGCFRHLESIGSLDQLSQILKVLWASQPFGIFGVIPGKLAIALTLLRILGPTASRSIRYIIYAMSFLSCAIALVDILLVFLQCSPPSVLWSPGLPATCLDPSIGDGFAYFTGCMFNAFRLELN